MRKATTLILLTAASVVAVCAAQAQSTSTATASDHESASSAAPQAKSAAPQTLSTPPQTASLASQSASAAPQKEVDTRGYQRVVVHGTQELFCKKQALTGSRITQTVCRTKAQLQAEQDSTKRLIENTQRLDGVGKSTYLNGGMAPH
jgi:hypothetical protein